MELKKHIVDYLVKEMIMGLYVSLDQGECRNTEGSYECSLLLRNSLAL